MSDIISAYEVAKSLVSTGKLRIIHIDAPPRTISSAFQIALTEGGDGHLYEPFRKNGGQDALEKTCKDIVSLYEKIGETRAEKPSQGSPVVLTVKELAQFLKDADFAKWLPLIGGWVSIVRSPNTQMQSFMTRSILNGSHFSAQQIEDARLKLFIENGKAASDFEVVYELSEDFRVKRGKRAPANVVLPHKLETEGFDMWGALSRHFQEVTTHNIPVAVVDGTILCTQPDQVMRHVAEALDLTFNPRMLSGWQIASGKNLMPAIPRDELKQDAWLIDAVTTHGLVPPQNQPLPLFMFTPSVRRYTAKALEFFMDFVNSPQAILPRNPESVEALFSTQMPEGSPFGIDRLVRDDLVFKEAQPIAAYSIALSMPVNDISSQSFKDSALAELDELHGHYRDSFEIMSYRQRAINEARL